MVQTAIINRHFNFGNDPTTGIPDVLIFDSVISEKHQFSIEITKNPVETGVSMTDHAYVNQVPLTLEVAVSDTPFMVEDQSRSMVPFNPNATYFTGPNVRRTVNAWQAILDKAESFAVFDVQTGLKLYQNMMFKEGSAEQNVDSSGVLWATIQVVPVIFAQTATVVYPQRGPKKTKRQAAAPVDGGKKDAPDPTSAQKRPPSELWKLKVGA
jgi:hypothetical protein